MSSLRLHFTNKSVTGAPYSIKSYSLSHSWTLWTINYYHKGHMNREKHVAFNAMSNVTAKLKDFSMSNGQVHNEIGSISETWQDRHAVTVDH